MTNTDLQFMLFVAGVLAALVAFIWMALTLRKLTQMQDSSQQAQLDMIGEAKSQAESVFNREFREELKNRGRLHFEKIINENAMFLQQDLRLTTSQLNDFMKDEIKRVLKEEFATYEESITGAKDQAIQAIAKTQQAIEDQRTVLEDQLQKSVSDERERAIKTFDARMAEIVNHYIVDAIGTEIDLSDQLDYIFGNLRDNKQAILEDMRDGS